MKVFGGLTFVSGKQVRTIVAASTKKEAAELIGVSLYCFNQYWTRTGNKLEIEAALANPRKVLRASTTMGCDFR